MCWRTDQEPLSPRLATGNSPAVHWPSLSLSDKDALCACSTKLIIGRGLAKAVEVLHRERGRCRLSKNAAYIRAPEPLKPLVSLVLMAGSRAYSQRENGRLHGSRTMQEVR